MDDTNTCRDRAIAEGVYQIETFIRGELPDTMVLIVEQILGTTYDTGYDDAVANIRLHNTNDAADQLGITRMGVIFIANRDGIGRRVSRDLVFTDRDIETMRTRRTQRGPEPGTWRRRDDA